MTPTNIAMTTLLNGVCLGAMLAATMTLMLGFFRRWNSTTRFTILWMTLLAVVALLATPFARRAFVVVPRTESFALLSPSPAAIPAPAPALVYRPGGQTDASVDPVPSESHGSMSGHRLESKPSQIAFTSAWLRASLSERSLLRIHSAKFLPAMAIVWLVFSCVLLVRLVLGYCVLRSLKSTATPAS